MSRKARTHSSLALALIAFLVAGLWFASHLFAGGGETLAKGNDKPGDSIVDANAPTTHAAKKAARTAVFPVPNEFKVKLLRAGLDPRALCAAGVASGSVLSTLQAAADQMNAAPSALESADASFASARVAADALARKIQSGRASQEEIASYPSAKSALESAEAARATVLDGYFAAATANLTASQSTALTNIRANKGWELPTEYLVVTRTEPEWVALRDALANERIAVELPGTESQAATSLLTTVRADGTVSAALTGVQNNLQSVTSAWNTAAGD